MRASNLMLAAFLMGGHEMHGTRKKSVEEITGYVPPEHGEKPEPTDDPEPPFKGKKTSKSRKQRKQARKQTT